MPDSKSNPNKDTNKIEKESNKYSNNKRSSWFNFGIFDKREQDPAKAELLSTSRDDPNEIELLL